MRFVVVLLIICGLFISAVFVGVYSGWFLFPSYFTESLIFISVTTLSLYAFLFRMRHSPMFTQLYLMSMVIKLTGSLAFIFLVILKDKASAPENAILFLLAYIIFTASEVYFLYHQKV